MRRVSFSFIQLKTIKKSQKRNKWSRKSHDSHFIKNVLKMFQTRAHATDRERSTVCHSVHASTFFGVLCCVRARKISVNKTCIFYTKQSNRFGCMLFLLCCSSSAFPSFPCFHFGHYLTLHVFLFFSPSLSSHAIFCPFVSEFLQFIERNSFALNINGMYLSGSNSKCYAIECERRSKQVNCWFL